MKQSKATWWRLKQTEVIEAPIINISLPDATRGNLMQHLKLEVIWSKFSQPEATESNIRQLEEIWGNLR